MPGTAIAAWSTSRSTDSTSRFPVRRTAISCRRRRSWTCTSSSSFTARSADSIASRSLTSAWSDNAWRCSDTRARSRSSSPPCPGAPAAAGMTRECRAQISTIGCARSRPPSWARGYAQRSSKARVAPSSFQSGSRRRVAPEPPRVSRSPTISPNTRIGRSGRSRPRRAPTTAAKRRGSMPSPPSMRASVSAASTATYWPVAWAVERSSPASRSRSSRASRWSLVATTRQLRSVASPVPT